MATSEIINNYIAYGFDNNILENILLNADPSIVPSVLNICHTNVGINKICKDDEFWGRKFIKDFGDNIINEYNLDWIIMYQYMMLAYILENKPNRYCFMKYICDTEYYLRYEPLYENYIIDDIIYIDIPDELNKFDKSTKDFFYKAKITKVNFLGYNVENQSSKYIYIKVRGGRYKNPIDIIDYELKSGRNINYDFNHENNPDIKNLRYYDYVGGAIHYLCNDNGVYIQNPIDLILITDCPVDHNGKKLPIPNLLVYISRNRYRVIYVDANFQNMKLQRLKNRNDHEIDKSNEFLDCIYILYKNTIRSGRKEKTVIDYRWVTAKINSLSRTNELVIFKDDCR